MLLTVTLATKPPLHWLCVAYAAAQAVAALAALAVLAVLAAAAGVAGLPATAMSPRPASSAGMMRAISRRLGRA